MDGPNIKKRNSPISGVYTKNIFSNGPKTLDFQNYLAPSKSFFKNSLFGGSNFLKTPVFGKFFSKFHMYAYIP